MNSFREKIGLILTDETIVETSYKTKTTTSVQDESIELLLECTSHGSIAVTLDGLKKRADTAETEISFPFQSSTREDSRLEDIGSYDDDECIIWYADSSLSLSNDENDRKLHQDEPTSTLSPLDTASVFAEADSMLGIQIDASSKSATAGKQKKSNNNPRDKIKVMRRGFFSSGILLTGRSISDFPSRIKNNNNNRAVGINISQSATSSAARSRQFFSVSKVPASIAEEPCNTPSSTSASVASSH
jgi:hypothetical protein